MKDVPTWLPNGTILPCCLPREETNDVLISNKYSSLSELPNHSIIGSASLRRQAQLMALNPTFKVINFRGNVQTRLKKLEKGKEEYSNLLILLTFFVVVMCVVFFQQGDVDATLLALAGLKRLKMNDLIKSSKILSINEMLPAVSQGAIGIQCRSNDQQILQYLQKLNHLPTKLAIDCERGFLEALDGNCRTPIAAQAIITNNNHLYFKGMILKSDGSEMMTIEKQCEIDPNSCDLKEFGREVGEEIKERLGEKKFHEFQETYN